MYSETVNKVISGFGLDSDKADLTPLAGGLINDTYSLALGDAHYVLQRINASVFPDPYALIHNADLITHYLDGTAYPLEPLRQKKAIDGKSYVVHHGVWRITDRIQNSFALQQAKNTQQAAQVANAFGCFSRYLHGFDANSLSEVLEDFHILPRRLLQLEQAVLKDSHKRRLACEPELSWLQEQDSLVKSFAQAIADMPARVCHNDTKINNMLLSNETQQAIAVIDWDTCMPGRLMFDFGDMVRSACAVEGTTGDMGISEPFFEAMSDAYLSEMKSVITPDEIDSLWLGCLGISLNLGVRFLTDFLDGERYFAATTPLQNLERAQTQFAIYRALQRQEKRLIAYLK